MMTADLATSRTLLPDIIRCKGEPEVRKMARKAVQDDSDPYESVVACLYVYAALLRVASTPSLICDAVCAACLKVEYGTATRRYRYWPPQAACFPRPDTSWDSEASASSAWAALSSLHSSQCGSPQVPSSWLSSQPHSIPMVLPQ